ncbi:gentisate 1,2-dioxygenase [Burkholderia gladioli pv. gladioli]|uniref:Gentisate 1,2-dioxygenase n=1 Tax=Burkholderia gladioli TaxID=28095 RepID=A0A095F0F7_BURGA|nr:gentisate 1,2-dioxygenase [Burkholderia gladioli]AJW99844.1 gentisate 1,2-dioxygenase [Burkholderia gladioli]ASD79966.1 gentisate 1,2-dioxygenase [Burkholderia gladioli pv. gladioli]AWY54788.1 gentisate 1,2-dioxygenase [Burkholderia gladioli pv. gladioli]KGC11131.1 gentisate 1,2-dioxygenase [Burkholderia gladioli]MDJ1164224.1 gentisate 1,2-dioxygenase [Burkholderia gladioli pv. gladioli]
MATSSLQSATCGDSAERLALYDQLDNANSAPLWAVMSQLVTPEPRPYCVPYKWDYSVMRELLLSAGKLITAKEAERRVLVLENPGIRGISQITQSLYAGLQLILPGEVAPTHRHAAAALRLIIEGGGGYTSVSGERIPMSPGDFILTPSWTFHDHGNLGDDPVIWLDGLDVPMVNLFDASFAEAYPAGETQKVERLTGDALARYGSNLLPVEYVPQGAASPVFHYPYSRVKDVLQRLHASGSLDPRHGIKLQYANPATGGYPLPTIAAFMQQLPARFTGAPYRSTDSTVYCVREGRGFSSISGECIRWQAGDVFVAPSWSVTSHHAVEPAVLFSFSDRPAQKALGLWREEALDY